MSGASMAEKVSSATYCERWACSPFNPDDLTDQGNLRQGSEIPDGWERTELRPAEIKRLGLDLYVFSWHRQGNHWRFVEGFVPTKNLAEVYRRRQEERAQAARARRAREEQRLEASLSRLEREREAAGFPSLFDALKRLRPKRLQQIQSKKLVGADRVAMLRIALAADQDDNDPHAHDVSLAAALVAASSSRPGVGEARRVLRRLLGVGDGGRLHHGPVLYSFVQGEAYELRALLRRSARSK